MSEQSKRHKEILDNLGARHGVRVLLVEGQQDTPFFERQLDLHGSTWRANWIVEHAGGKKELLKLLESEPTWLGIADRDETSDTSRRAQQNQYRTLRFMDRYCLESYFITPGDLWAILPDPQKARISGGYHLLEQGILSDLARWTRHGVLLQVINPLWPELRAIGFKEHLLDFTNAQDDALIQLKLKQWHELLEPNRIFAKFQTQLTQVRTMTTEEQLRTIIHGKMFFRVHVVPLLNRLLGSKDASTWRKDLIKTCPSIPEFEPLWREMGL